MRPLNSPHTIRAVLLGLAVGLSGHLPVLAVSGPPLRTGLWVTQKISEAAADPTAFEAAVRGNPHLSGVCLSVGWREIENEAGKTDFSSIDKAVAVLRRIGMKYELGIKPGVDTPPFVYQQGAQSFANPGPESTPAQFWRCSDYSRPVGSKVSGELFAHNCATWRTLQF